MEMDEESKKAIVAGAILGAMVAGPEGAAAGALLLLLLKEYERRSPV